MKAYSVFLFTGLLVASCTRTEPTTTRLGPHVSAVISDAAHDGGTAGFYFLPPMVSQPVFTGAFDGDIATLNPQIAICDVSNGPDTACGGSSVGATPAVAVFTTTTTPAITVDLTTPQYQVNWDTKAAGFVVGHTYRLHVSAGPPTARRELGFADILLTTTPGQVKHLATDSLIVLQDGRTLPVHFRVEAGIPASIVVTAATAQVPTSGTDLITATVVDLHGAPMAGVGITWSSLSTPVVGVIAGVSPGSGITGSDGTTTAQLTAGTNIGTVTVSAATSALTGSVQVGVIDAGFTLAVGSVTMGERQSCGLTKAGVAYCWGGNDNLALGLGPSGVEGGAYPVPQPVAGGLRFSQIGAGSLHTCGLTVDSLAYCWGYAGTGEVGNGTFSGDYGAPQRVLTTLRFSQLSVGGDQSCALASDNTAWCWGMFTGAGQTDSPVAVPGGQTFAQVFSGAGSTCAVTATLVPWCWGGGPPSLVPGGHAFKMISVGANAACALDLSGAVWCWGRPEFGTPVAVAPGFNFSTLQVSYFGDSGQVCGLVVSSSVYCWQVKVAGSLDRDYNISSTTPVQSAVGFTFVALVGAEFGSPYCGTTTGGAVYCWGGNGQGQLGDGTLAPSDTPMRVVPPSP